METKPPVATTSPVTTPPVPVTPPTLPVIKPPVAVTPPVTTTPSVTTTPPVDEPQPSVIVEPPVESKPIIQPTPFIGIIDTGFAPNNPDLDYSKVTLGRDRIDKDSNPLFTAGTGNEHGTFNWGLVSAIQGNDKGIDGYNDKANVYLSRAIGSGEWDLALNDFVSEAKGQKQKNAIALLPLDLTQKNADGTITTRYEFTNRERAVLENARQSGVLLVVAAGNDGGVMSVLGQSSQEFENIITVGSSDGFGRSDYSSYGYGLDILVPGGTIDNPTLSTVGDDIGTMSGTSASAAKAAGMASKVWEANPDLNPKQIIDILTGSAIDLKEPGWDQETGFGVVNLNKAVQVAKETKPQSYTPSPFLSPTTWGLEGKVTPWERATYDIKTGSFTSIIWSTDGVNLRNSTNLSDRSSVNVAYQKTVTFDAWTYGEAVPDLTTKQQDALWFRTNVNGQSYWVPSAYTKGYPPGNPPLLPPANTNPVITNPGTTNPVITNPGTTNPVITNPVITNPVITNPPPSSISINGRTIGGSFYPVFQNYKATLGNPTSDAINYNGVSYQTFDKGSIVSSKNGTFPLYGAIRQEFLKTGGLDGWLGAPKSAEKGQGDGTLIQYFEKGHISWNGVKAIAYEEGNGQSNYLKFADNASTIGGDLSSIPDIISARRAVSKGGIVNSNIKGSFAKDVVDSIKKGVIREEVGLFVMSILATESGGGNWQANNGKGYLGAFQMGKNERQAFAPGVSDQEFLANKDIQLKAAQGLYDQKLLIIQNKAQTGELHSWTTEPDQQPLDQHFAGKSNIYKAAYAWLTLAGEDGNHVYSKDYAQAADESAKLINQTLGINKGSLPSISVPNQPVLGDDHWWDLQTGDSFLYSNQEDPKNNSKLYSELQTIERSQQVRQVYVELSKAIFKGSLIESESGYAYDKGYIQKFGWIHSGVDISASTTNVIHSPVDGIVVKDIPDYYGTGRAIAVQEKVDGKPVNRFWWYLHLAAGTSKFNLSVTAKETPIGNPGIIPNQSPHLHLTVATATRADDNEATNVRAPNVNQAQAAINEMTAKTMSPLQAFWEAKNKVIR
ncbi:S8 family serine peptidase [Microcoleus sp. CAWBG640]|uniref:S8 family serine peptidase n=1 Tax=Microcoleus sp. CAWBG640 TaxID=2841653 RepID=UPI00312B47A7